MRWRLASVSARCKMLRRLAKRVRHRNSRIIPESGAELLPWARAVEHYLSDLGALAPDSFVGSLARWNIMHAAGSIVSSALKSISMHSRSGFRRSHQSLQLNPPKATIGDG